MKNGTIIEKDNEMYIVEATINDMVLVQPYPLGIEFTIKTMFSIEDIDKTLYNASSLSYKEFLSNFSLMKEKLSLFLPAGEEDYFLKSVEKKEMGILMSVTNLKTNISYCLMCVFQEDLYILNLENI